VTIGVMSEPPPAGPRWLALVFRWLSADRLRATRPHLFVHGDTRPLGFVEAAGRTVRLAALDRAAWAAGLRPGTTIPDAHALVPDLWLFPHDLHADLDWLERLADACHRYTPAVVPLPPDALLLDVAGCAGGGERALAADVERRFAGRGLLARHAFGDTKEIAHALARYAGAPAPDERGAVRRLPLAALGLDADATVALAAAGWSTVGEVMAQPRAHLAARFGTDVAAAVRALAGAAPRPAERAGPTPLAAERHLPDPVATTDQVLAVLADLAERLRAALDARGEGGRRWEAGLFRVDGQVDRVPVQLDPPTRDVPRVLGLLRERIDARADPLDPSSGYDLVRLEVPVAEPWDAHQFRLEGGMGRRGDPPVPSARSAARAGRGPGRRVGRGQEQAEMDLFPTHTPALRSSGPDTASAHPIHLFDPPEPVDPLGTAGPDRPPARFRWRRRVHEVARAAGPERVAGEWWRRSDGEPHPRDYYRVEDRRGRRLWLFRLGVDGDGDGDGDGAGSRWYVHGLFA